MCIVMTTFCSMVLMGCLYTQPNPSQANAPMTSEAKSDTLTVNSGQSNVLQAEATLADSTALQPAIDPTVADSAKLSRRDLLEVQIKKWSGTPHRWGGDNLSGIDCSALVQIVYQDVFGTSIPRTTKKQVRVGDRIPVSKLEIGDLVFYRINARTRHVGIYVGDNAFFHASKSEGVAVTSLDAPYWRSRFWMARRILPSEPGEREANGEGRRIQVTW